MHFDMLCTWVEHRVPSQIDTAHVVAIKGSQIFDGYAQVLEYPLEPTPSHAAIVAPLYSASVLERATVACFLLL